MHYETIATLRTPMGDVAIGGCRIPCVGETVYVSFADILRGSTLPWTDEHVALMRRVDGTTWVVTAAHTEYRHTPVSLYASVSLQCHRHAP